MPWESTALDDVDQRIVAALSADGRMSMRSLASQVHISRANVYARVERLTREGVIEGFEARVDPARAGLRTSAYIGIHVEQNAWRELAEQLAQIPYVGHVALLSGEFDVLLRIDAPDNTVLRDVVLEQIQQLAGVRATRTWLVFEDRRGQAPYGSP